MSSEVRRTVSGRIFRGSYADLDPLLTSPPPEVPAPSPPHSPLTHINSPIASSQPPPPPSAAEENPSSLPLADRLHAIQGSLLNYGFTSVAECMLAELQCEDPHIRRRSSRFVQTDYLGKIFCAASDHPSFSFDRMRADIPLRTRLIDLVAAIVAMEMEALVSAQAMRKPVNQFTHEYLSEFSSSALAQVQKDYAPAAKRLVDTMVSPVCLQRGSFHFKPGNDIEAEEEDSHRDTQNTLPRGRRRDLVSTAALCVAAYGRSQRANALQGMVGYYLSACDAGKRVIETLHCMGFSVTYESVLKALKSNALAVRKMLRQRARIRPFFVSFDNMVFYQRVKTHLMGNRQHQRHYTAGYIAFLEGAQDEGFLARKDMLDWGRAAAVSIADIMIHRNTLEYAREAAAANIWSILYKHFRGSILKNMIKYSKDGNVLRHGYESFAAPKVFPLPIKRSELHTMISFSKNEAVINEVIEILRGIMEELNLPAEQLLDKIILFKGDYMTVRNIMKAIYRRQEDDPIHQMSFVEPVIGLFHLQMCMLGTIYKAHWGNEESLDPTSIKRFAKMMGKPAVISPKVKDFRAYNAFFDELLDAYVITLAAQSSRCETYDQLDSHLAKADWRTLITSMVNKIMPLDQGFSAVHQMRYDGHGNEVPLEERDIVYENSLLFLQQGLLYRDFDAAVSAGDPGRLENILSIWTTQLHGTQSINYPREMIHHMACLQKIWSPALRDLWRRNCLVNPSGRAGAWMPDDLFGEYVVREIKAKIHPSSNRQSDNHLRETISCQVMSLYACKMTMHKEFRARDYGQSSTLVSNTSDVAHIVRTLIGEGATILARGRCSDIPASPTYWQAQDMLALGGLKIATGLPLKDYKMRARFNWHAHGSPEEDLDVDGEEGGFLGPDISLDDLL